MADQNSNEIIDLVKIIAKSYADYPEEIELSIKEENSALYIEIISNETDRRRIIGKMGHNINALRTVVHALGKKLKKRTYITIIED